MNWPIQDAEHLHVLWKNSQKGLDEAIERLNQTQADGARERTQYFEKLAIGSGAAIAAIVSFVGTHAGKLHPAWILRCSLVALVVAMIAALYRNLRYPTYVLATYNKLWIEASRHQQQCKNDVFLADRNVRSLQSGGPIDLQDCTAGFKESDAKLETLIIERTERENRLLKEFRAAEYVCISFVCVAMVSLVWLALANF
jgi:hypothetical protein